LTPSHGKNILIRIADDSGPKRNTEIREILNVEGRNFPSPTIGGRWRSQDIFDLVADECSGRYPRP